MDCAGRGTSKFESRGEWKVAAEVRFEQRTRWIEDIQRPEYNTDYNETVRRIEVVERLGVAVVVVVVVGRKHEAMRLLIACTVL